MELPERRAEGRTEAGRGDGSSEPMLGSSSANEAAPTPTPGSTQISSPSGMGRKTI